MLVYSGLPLTLIELECKDCPIIITCKVLSRVGRGPPRLPGVMLSHWQGPIRQLELHAGEVWASHFCFFACHDWVR